MFSNNINKLSIPNNKSANVRHLSDFLINELFSVADAVNSSIVCIQVFMIKALVFSSIASYHSSFINSDGKIYFPVPLEFKPSKQKYILIAVQTIDSNCNPIQL